jgi:hypothetical protein
MVPFVWLQVRFECLSIGSCDLLAIAIIRKCVGPLHHVC